MSHSVVKLFMLALLGVGFFLQIGCSDRARLNPLDPSNPNSNGAPTGLRVYSQRHTVTLLWYPMEINDLEQYYIYRGASDGSLIKYDSTSANATQYTDADVTFDTKYTYAIQAQTRYDASQLSETRSIVPGAFDILVADYYSQSLQRVTYDGNSLFERYDGYTPTDLAFVNSRIYFTNLWDQSLKYLDSSGAVHSFPVGQGPVDFAVDEKNQLIYVLDRDDNSLTTLTFDGEFRNEVTLDMDVKFYSDVAYDPVLNCLWITDESLHTIHRYDPATGRLAFISENLSGPDEITIDTINGGCWIASMDGIIRINGDNSIERMLSSHYIYDIALDKSSDRFYYSGYYTETETWEIGYVDHFGNTVLHTSYQYIYKLKIIPETNGVGLLLVNGYDSELIRLNAQGQEIGRRTGIYGVTGIALQ